MNAKRIENIVILGGGTAGWICAATFAKLMPADFCNVTLIESSDIPTVGVGEATIPPILDFIKFLGINEQEFVQATQATFKLGIQFDDWLRVGHSYFHQFGAVGVGINQVPFYQQWQRVREQLVHSTYTDYSPAAMMAKRGKFIPPSMSGEESILRGASYALHFDAGLVANFLADHSVAMGVQRKIGTVVDVRQSDSGFIDSLLLNNDERIKGDLFIDCSGFKGALIEGVLNAGYTNWQHFLPCDSAQAVASQKLATTPPFTRATAQDAGWQWRIPLQSRTGNGYVYCSQFCSDAEAERTLLKHLESEPTADIRKLKFVTGHRNKMWYKNCVAVGLAAGFLEPLESTGIHLIMRSVKKLIELFPRRNCDESLARAYNASLVAEYEAIRDFLMLHYVVTERRDTEFWRLCGDLPLPDSLQAKIDLFKAQGKIVSDPNDLFMDNNWQAVFEGMGIHPRACDPLAELTPTSEVLDVSKQLYQLLDQVVGSLPSHDEFIQKLSRAGNSR